jgi:hypothetical protein
MNTLRSGQVRYPGNRWGAFADSPALDVGIAEEAWVSLARSARIESGGTEEKFNEAFPRYADLLPQPTSEASRARSNT